MTGHSIVGRSFLLNASMGAANIFYNTLSANTLASYRWAKTPTCRHSNHCSARLANP